MPLPDILQWAAAGRKTGTLHVARRSIKKRIILRDGQVYSSWSNDPRESLGQFLVRLRLVTEEQLFRALLAQEEKGRPRRLDPGRRRRARARTTSSARSGSRPRRRSTISSSGPRASSSSTKASSRPTSRSRSRRR